MKKITPLVLSFFLLPFSEYLFAQDAPLIEWQTSLGGTGFENGRDAIETNDHGFVVVGYTESNDDDVSGNHGDDDECIEQSYPRRSCCLGSDRRRCVSGRGLQSGR
jgi:hypothetical protein